MKRFWALMRVGLGSLLAGRRGGTKRRGLRVSGVLGSAAVLAGVGLYLSGFLSYTLLKALAPIHMEVLVFALLGLLALVSGVTLTAFSVKDAVFGGRDDDLLLSLPISTTLLTLSRVAAIYLECLLLSFFMLAPAGVACAIMSKGGVGRSVGFWLRLGLVTGALPLLNTAVSVALGALIAWIGARVTRKAFGQTLIMGVYVLAIFYLSFRMSGMIENLAVNAGRILSVLKWLKPVYWLASGIVWSWPDAARFALLCLIPFIAVTLLLGRFYQSLSGAFHAGSGKRDFRLTVLRENGAAATLLKKEFLRFAGSPVLFWNTILGPLMLAGAGVALVVKRREAAKLLGMVGSEAGLMGLIPLGVAAFTLSTVVIAASSISLEGNRLWILRTLPVSDRRLIGVKLLFQMMIALPFAAVATACLAISGLMDAGQCVRFALFCAMFEAGHACFGMLMGLTFPRLDLNDASIAKRSLSAFLSMFVPLAVMALAAFLGWLWKCGDLYTLADRVTIAALIASAIFAMASAAVLWRRGPRLLRRIEL